jgi:DnaD/phage-associated family protein
VENRHFHGFPAKTEPDSVLDLLFTQLMPQILDVTELKVTMSIFYLLSKAKNLHKQGYSPFVRYEELLSQTGSMPGIDEKALRHALDLAVGHGSILRLNLNMDGEPVEAYFANIESAREAISSIERSGVSAGKEGTRQALQRSNIFALYEQNIGIITPMIAEELKEAERLYPAQWIEEALREAVVLNKRSWKYIARILERWASEGKDSGEYRQGVKKGSPDKYIKGKYGHLVKR